MVSHPSRPAATARTAAGLLVLREAPGNRPARLSQLRRRLLGAAALAGALLGAGWPGSAVAASRAVSVTAVRFWSLGEVTRVAVQTSGEFRYKYGRLSNPDRIYFDILNSRQRVSRHNPHVINVNDGLIGQIRVAQNTRSVTRVALDLVGNVKVTSSQLANPYRLMIEVRGKPAPSKVSRLKKLPSPARQKVAASKQPAKPTPSQPVRIVQKPPAAPAVENKQAPQASHAAVDKPAPPKQVASASAPPGKPLAAPRPSPPSNTVAQKAKPAKKTVPAPPVETASALRQPAKTPPAAAPANTRSSSADTAPVKAASPKPVPAAAGKTSPKPSAPGKAVAQTAKPATGGPPEPPTATKTPPAPSAPVQTARLRPPAAKPAPAAKPRPEAPEVEAVIPQPAKRNRSGARSLTRVLGLKLGRVVIDPGHGGKDTGTIGPTGLREKDVTLDVAKRLGKLIEERLGSEVVYTRTKDVSVPLEERTRLANEVGADLFLSIHVNSSRYRSVSGVETFYLNLTRSRADLEVAARENAGSNKSIHELSDLVRKIALDDKVQESRDFAASLQAAVYRWAKKIDRRARNRGVKKAPFVVLIGAKMPSVLVELGFISNPTEERLMKDPRRRQEIAEALYEGLAAYASTLSHFQVARAAPGEE